MEVNPFIALQDNLRFALARHMLPTQSIQLYILSVLLAISLIISLVALGFRIKNKTFWLVQSSKLKFMIFNY